MYKITKVLDKNGNSKDDFLEKIKANHPSMSGEILYPEFIRAGGCFCLVWDNDDKMLRTSTIEEYENNDGKVKVVTRNSIYYLEEIK